MINKQMLSSNLSVKAALHAGDLSLVDHQSQKTVPSASTIKVLIMAAALESLEEKLDQQVVIESINEVAHSLSTEMGGRVYSLYDLITLMITVSDNSATNQLIDVLGMDQVNELAVRLGLNSTRLRRKMMDLESKAAGIDNVTCVGDLFALAELIRTGALKGHETMKQILSNNRDRTMLARFLEEDCFLAHKTGLNSDVVIDFGFDDRMTVAACVTGDSIEIDGAETIGMIYRDLRGGRDR